MGLFGKSRAEKERELEQCRENIIRIGTDSLVNLKITDEERINLMEQIEESLISNFPYIIPDLITIIGKACAKTKEEYPDFAERIGLSESQLYEDLESTNSINVEIFNELLFEINWKYNTTPEDAEQILKNSRANGTPLSTENYKIVMAKIAEKYESELLEELDTVAPEEIEEWIDTIKSEGKVISSKAYAKAKAIERGEPWLSEEEYQKK